MDANGFDTFVRTLSVSLSHRGIGCMLAGLTLGGVLHPALGLAGVEARMRRKKNGKLKRNSCGCVNVGGKCRGKSANCCAGVCEGKKPKNGKKDTSRCVAHNVLDCPAEADSCLYPVQ